jgi:hypothetical protein
LQIPAIHTDIIPVERIFLKQRLDLLTAKSWLEQSKAVESEIVNLSKENNIPSAYTTMVVFESTHSKLQEQGEVDNEDKSQYESKDELYNEALLPKKAVSTLCRSNVLMCS